MANKNAGKKRISRKVQARGRVERLEDRILLSAQPLLLAPAVEAAGAAEIVAVDHTQAHPSVQSQLDSLVGFATFIDLGQGVKQSSALLADAADPSLLRLNDELTVLVLDLGSGNNAAVLSSAGDGKLRLSGASFNDIIFTRPTVLLGIRGNGGIDSVVIESVDLGSLVVEAETISLAAGQTLTASGEVTLRARAEARQSQGTSAAVDLLARVSIEGAIRAGAEVTLDASVFTEVTLSPKDTWVNATINANTAAEAVIGARSSVQASGLSVTANTYGRLQIAASGAASGSVAIDARQSTVAGVLGGAALTITGHSTGGAVDLLVEAVNQSRVASSLNTSDSLISSLTGFDLGLGRISLQRNTLAYLGQVEGNSAARLSLTGLDGTAAGLVQVSAASLDSPDGGVEGQVVSNLIGVQRNAVGDQVQALVGGADLTVSGLQVYALNASSLGANAKVASNQASGATRALIANSAISAHGDLRLLATDQARFEATSAGFSANLGLLTSVAVGIAAASNEVDRSLLASLTNSTVQAGALVVIAHSAATLTANAEAMAFTGGGVLAPGYKLAVGGSYAWNQVLGTVEASIQRSSVTAASQGGVKAGATNTTAVSAASVAGAAASGGSALGASLAFNAVGWRMDNIAIGAISSLIGSDLGSTELPLETRAFVSGSTVDAAGAVSVTALNAITLDAVITSSADTTSSLGALAFGAAAVLASNRVRSDTKAYIERAAASGSVAATGSVTVSAIDDAGIQADVKMSAAAGAVGASLAVGGIVVRNDVRGAVTADLDVLSVATGGDLLVEALESAQIGATLSGVVKAGGDSGFAAQVAGSGPSLAANALIATNLVLSDAQARVRNSALTVGGSADIAARNASTIEADNEAITESGSVAAGVTLAFNTIGWRAQNLLSAGLDALLGSSLGVEVPASVSATVLGGSLQAGGDVSVTANADETLSAKVSNQVAAGGAGASASLVLASNLVSASAMAAVRPMTGAAPASRWVLSAGGSVTVAAADRAAIKADVSMGSSSAGGVAVGGVVVRNDVRSAVDASIGQVILGAGAEVSVLALDAAEITSNVSSDTVSLGAESASTETGESPSFSLAVNALIATNLVLSSASASVLNSSLVVGGDLTVAADNAASIAADNRATLSSDDLAVGLTLAFNTIGWQAQNLLFNAVDALIGTDIGTEQPASVSATVVNTGLAVAGDVTVSAGGLAADAAEPGKPHGSHLSATIRNEVSATGENASVSLVLASNRVSSRARAWISPLADREAAAVSMVGALTSLSVDGSLSVKAVDNAQIGADVSMSATSGGGTAVGGVVVRNDVRSAVSSGVDRVALNVGGDVSVVALEAAQINAGLSGKSQTAAEEPESPPGEPAASGPIAAAPGAGGAGAGGAGAGGAGAGGAGAGGAGAGGAGAGGAGAGGAAPEKSMPPLALNGLIANNLVLSSSLASLTHSSVLAGGSLTVQARNESGIEAGNSAVIESGGVAVGVSLAFNTIGWQPQDIFRKTIDGLLGTSFGNEVPAVARASIEDSALDIGGDLSVDAAVVAVVGASTSNEASSVGASAAASLVLATNFVSSSAEAYIVQPVNSTDKTQAGGALTVTASNAPSVVADTKIVASSTAGAAPEAGDAYSRVDFSSEDGEQTVKFGSQVMLAEDYEAGGTGGQIYRYMGGAPKGIDLSAADYTDAGYWYELVPAEGKAGDLLALVDQAKKLVNPAPVTDTKPDSSAAWSAVERSASGAPAQSESQTLTLPAHAGAGAHFALAIETNKTAPIDLLQLGVHTDEVQRLTVLPGTQAQGQSYTLTMGVGRSTSLVFAGVADTDAARIQTAIEAWVGPGNVAVSFDTASRAGGSFNIHFKAAAAGIDQAQVSASAAGAAATQLSFNSRTVTQGGAGATTADQAALIAAGLDAVYGEGAVQVVWQSSAAGQHSYRIDFTGADLADRDLPMLRVVDKSAGLTTSVASVVQGAVARGDSFALARCVAAGTETFDLEVTIDGVAYLATAISDKATDAAVAAAIAAALSPQKSRWLTPASRSRPRWLRKKAAARPGRSLSAARSRAA